MRGLNIIRGLGPVRIVMSLGSTMSLKAAGTIQIIQIVRRGKFKDFRVIPATLGHGAYLT